MKLLPLLGCLALAGCVSDATAARNYAKMSDADLIYTHHAAVQGGLFVPRYRDLTTAEMKRRGLMGPGRDGIPAEGQR